MSLSVMIKPASSLCNLDCKYCFYHSLASTRKEFSKGMMSKETARRIIDTALKYVKNEEVVFTFQGGEPLLCPLDFYKDFVEYANEQNKYDADINYCLQTNGTLIDDEFARFFAENDFLIGVSLDGDRELNRYRVYANGDETFDDVLKGIEILNKHKVDFNILSVLTKNTARNIRQAWKFFKQNEYSFLQFTVGLRPFEGEYDRDMYMDVDDYAYFLNKCYRLYYNNNMKDCSPYEYISVRAFDNYDMLYDRGFCEQCGMNGKCTDQYVIEGDGSVYPCDFYCTDEWYLGNINDTDFKSLDKSKKRIKFINESLKISEKCRKCKYDYLCKAGGCKRYRQDYDYCEAYKNFFENNENYIKLLVEGE